LPNRDVTPVGARRAGPNLWTSDVEGSRRFYCEMFGWEAQEPSPAVRRILHVTRRGVARRPRGWASMGDMAPTTRGRSTSTPTTSSRLSRGRSGWRAVHGPAHAGRRPGHPSSLHGFDRRHARRLAGRGVPGFQVLEEARCSTDPGRALRALTTPPRSASTKRCSARRPGPSPTRQLPLHTCSPEGSDVELAGIMDARTFLARESPRTDHLLGGGRCRCLRRQGSHLGGSGDADSVRLAVWRIAAVAGPDRSPVQSAYRSFVTRFRRSRGGRGQLAVAATQVSA